MHTNQSLEVMKKAGRKPLPEWKKRSHRLEVRLNNGEMNLLQSLADRQKMGLSETIRKAIEVAYEKI